jgi:hypothetical protein
MIKIMGNTHVWSEFFFKCFMCCYKKGINYCQATIDTYVLLLKREREEIENADRVANMEC